MSGTETSKVEKALVMPTFFPRAPKECKAPAETFFECFTAKVSVKIVSFSVKEC